MNTRIPLSAEKRTVFGHKTKSLRKNNIIPATVYGVNTESMSLSLAKETFMTVFKQAGVTHLIDLSVGGKTVPVLIHDVQQNPLSRAILHVEFHVVNLKEKLKTHVPLVTVGESPAVKENLGMLLTLLNEIEIEALPSEIPEHIEVDITSLTAVDSEVLVSTLKAPNGVEILAEPEIAVVKIGAHVVEKAPEPTEAMEAATEESPDAATDTAANTQAEKTEASE